MEKICPIMSDRDVQEFVRQCIEDKCQWWWKCRELPAHLDYPQPDYKAMWEEMQSQIRSLINASPSWGHYTKFQEITRTIEIKHGIAKG